MDSKNQQNQTNDLFLNEYHGFKDLFDEMIIDLEMRKKSFMEKSKECNDSIIYYKAIYKHIEDKNRMAKE